MLVSGIKRKRIPYFAPWAQIKDGSADNIYHIENNAVVCDVKDGKEYSNHIETAGFHCSAIISYQSGLNRELKIMRHAVFPNFRLYPNNTHSSLDHNFNGVEIMINGRPVFEKAISFSFDGMINIYSECDGAKIKRTLFAARNAPALIELIEIEPASNSDIELVNRDEEYITSKIFGDRHKQYRLFCKIEKETVSDNNHVRFNVCYCAADVGKDIVVNAQDEYTARLAFIKEISDSLDLETPDETVNSMFRYSKLRASESIFDTKCGLMHSPGGGSYYAALWTNDQCEYVNPLFGYMGYKKGVDEAINCYNLYNKYISTDKPLVSSIVACGDDVWHGAGDRGDSAMYAYGCSRFLLSMGNKELAKHFIAYIDDCLTYTLSQKNEYGVIRSDSDELENRFESGSANLSTACLTYDALLSAAIIHKEFADEKMSKFYCDEADKLKASIESYFGKNIEGFNTYMYCNEEKRLRSWICLPLTVGINDRADDTAAALLSDKLRKGNGLLTRSGEKTFWDRSALYAMRGLFRCGKADEAAELLISYSKCRHLGCHPPYAVEAYPEGNQAQLSAESGLYVRIFTEGILGYRPTGFSSFELCPHLPSYWNKITLSGFKVCNKIINIDVTKQQNEYQIKISGDINETYTSSSTISVSL